MTKDYSYRSKWKHFYSRAYNKAKRGNLTKKEMFEKYKRFPKKDEWWCDIPEKEWIENYIKTHPKPE